MHWELEDSGLYWVDEFGVFVPVEIMEDADWWEAFTGKAPP